MKYCLSCQKTKPLSDFYKCRTAKDGLTTRCKPCCYKRKKTDETKWFEKHSESLASGRFTCLVCNDSKEFSEFYPHPRNYLGITHQCRSCTDALKSVWKEERKRASMTPKERAAHTHRLWVDKMKSLGLCVRCGKAPAAPKRTSCLDCLLARCESENQRRHLWKLAGYCFECGNPNRSPGKNYCPYCLEEVSNLRIMAIGYLGGECRCCGETESRFLTIDHMNNDGKDDRGSDRSLYRAILRGEREDLQAMCFNCNCGRQLNGGYCPHFSTV